MRRQPAGPDPLTLTTINPAGGLTGFPARLAKPERIGHRTWTMPQTTASDAQAPATATPAPAQPQATVAPRAPTAPISPEQAEFLRARRTALGNQLESVQERRDEVAEQLRRPETQSYERQGLENRLRVLDERLIQIEREMAVNSAELANAPPRQNTQTGTGAASGGTRIRSFNPNLVTILTFALLMPLAIQFARRMFGPRSARYDREQLAEAAALRARIDKLESSIDTVAFEVERIGEGQRFLTQAMIEPLAKAKNAGLAVPVESFDATSGRA